MSNYPFTIIVDTREQQPWQFTDHEVAKSKLDTGDYSIQGLEDSLAIERKKSVSEIATNINQERFINTLERLQTIKYKFMLFEFSLDDVMNFPIGSNIPKRIWSKIKVRPKYLVKKITEIHIKYNIHTIFCGDSENATNIALSIMRQVYGQEYKKV
jgi:DNA excision repair protein ERCC-4